MFFKKEMLKLDIIRSNKWININLFIIFIAVVSLFFSSVLAILYASQPLLDLHSFRQTQTALTAYWFIQEGFKLAYETPVIGPPWSIPFEFPIYQFIVAVFSKVFGFSLDFSGRITSYVFLIFCLIPVRSITRKLHLPDSVFYIFTAILMSTPIYVYWGRSFMIETAALFFVIVAIKYFIDLLIDGFTFRRGWLYFIFMIFSILQKATTGAPVLIVLSLVFLAFEMRKTRSIKYFFFSSRFLLGVFYFIIPLAIGVLWTFYTDYIKSFNSLGSQLTSASLKGWNWGSIETRFSSDLYIKVLWERIFRDNIAGIFGIIVLLLSLILKYDRGVKTIIVISLMLGVFPLFLFPNLHIVHDYYQSANVIFLIYAVAVALGGVITPFFGGKVLIVSLAIILTSNYIALNREYLPQIRYVFSKGNSRDYAIGEIIKKEVKEGKQFIVFGNDWSSTFAYISQRKSFTVPKWFKLYKEAVAHPENFVDYGQLGAIVSCTPEKPSLMDLISWSADKKEWKIGEAQGCYIVTPQRLAQPTNSMDLIQCHGNFDTAAVEQRGEARIVLFSGWAVISEGKNIAPENMFIALSKLGGEVIYLDTFQINRPDVNTALGLSDKVDIGFSRIIDADLPQGEYVVKLAQVKGNVLRFCQFQKQFFINGNSRSE